MASTRLGLMLAAMLLAATLPALARPAAAAEPPAPASPGIVAPGVGCGAAVAMPTLHLVRAHRPPPPGSRQPGAEAAPLPVLAEAFYRCTTQPRRAGAGPAAGPLRRT